MRRPFAKVLAGARAYANKTAKAAGFRMYLQEYPFRAKRMQRVLFVLASKVGILVSRYVTLYTANTKLISRASFFRHSLLSTDFRSSPLASSTSVEASNENFVLVNRHY